jgi:hypothetical protein
VANVAMHDDREPDTEGREPRIGAGIEGVCHDVNSALATVILCVEFLAERSADVDAPAVDDARTAVRRIVGEMANLRKIAVLARDAEAGGAQLRQAGSLTAIGRRGGS